jgi:hypothetical protein
MSDGEDSEAEEFTESLVYIGFNCVTAEVIVKQGFTSPMMLLTVTEDSLSEMTRQVARSNLPNGLTSRDTDTGRRLRCDVDWKQTPKTFRGRRREKRWNECRRRRSWSTRWML